MDMRAAAQHYECVIDVLRGRRGLWDLCAAPAGRVGQKQPQTREQQQDAEAFEAVVLRLCLRVLPFERRSVRRVPARHARCPACLTF